MKVEKIKKAFERVVITLEREEDLVSLLSILKDFHAQHYRRPIIVSAAAQWCNELLEKLND